MTSLDTTDEVFTDDLRQRAAQEQERRRLEKWSMYRYDLTLAELDYAAMQVRRAKEDADGPSVRCRAHECVCHVTYLIEGNT